STAECRGLIEAPTSWQPSRAGKPLSTAECRGLIEALISAIGSVVPPWLSTAECRGLIEILGRTSTGLLETDLSAGIGAVRDWLRSSIDLLFTGHVGLQLVQAPDEGARSLQLPTLGKQCLVEQQVAPVGEARIRLLLAQALHQRMVGFDPQDGLA